jgi:hypothetical protein
VVNSCKNFRYLFDHPSRSPQSVRPSEVAVLNAADKAPAYNGFDLARDVYQSVRVSAVAILLSIITALLLWLPDQTREIYRAIAQDLAFAKDDPDVLSDYREIVFATLGLILLGVTLCYVSRLLLSKFSANTPNKSIIARSAAKYTPALTAVIPLAGASRGIWTAQTNPMMIDASKQTLFNWLNDYYATLSPNNIKIIFDRFTEQIDSIERIL